MKRKQLQWWDVVIISMILFGFAIWNSTMSFWGATPDIVQEELIFTTADNWFGMLTTSIELLLSFLYLHFRKFDFSVWKYKITWKSTLCAIVIFLVLSVLMDAVDVLFYGWKEIASAIGQDGLANVLSEIDGSLILFSLLNGFYEEIFFLGICTLVPERQKNPVFLYSLMVRTAFHTYQGIVSAASIGLIVGILYYALYKKKSNNLYPYMLSHTFADIFGAGLLSLF